MIDPEEQARADVYGLMASLLQTPPGESMLNALRRMSGALGEAARELDATAVGEEFHALFVGAGSGGEVVPYASWHRTGFLMEEPLAHLRANLAELGLARQAGVSEPEDHMAGLCETMRLMIESGFPLMRQKEFYQRHMAPWAEAFTSQLEGASNARFYAAVAGELRTLMKVEAMAFDMVEEEERS